MLPLEGITIISIEQAVAAPFATRQLADLGARVVKIERPDVGDFARGYDETVRGMRKWTILAAFGSPDRYGRQIDGLGGATSLTSKAAIISKGTQPGIDFNFTFGQVSIEKPLIDMRGNCGNISAAVGPYAIDEGLVPCQEPMTQV